MKKSKIQKTLFAKLYPYYCRKLLGKLPLALINLLIVGFLVLTQIYFRTRLGLSFSFFISQPSITDVSSLTNFLKEIFNLSSSSLLLIYTLGAILVTGLVGGYMGGQIKFGLTKQSSRGEDIKTLVFTSRITRKDVIWAKFVALFTYCFAFNFCLTTLPYAIYFLASSEISLVYLLFFLVLHGLVLNLTYFSLLVPALFYVNSSGSMFLLIFYFFLFIFLGSLGWIFLKSFISQHLFLFFSFFCVIISANRLTIL